MIGMREVIIEEEEDSFFDKKENVSLNNIRINICHTKIKKNVSFV